MSRVHLLKKYIQSKNTFLNVLCRFQKAESSSSSSSSSNNNSNSSSSSSDEENKLQEKLEEKKKSKEALDKLNRLLLTMTGEDAPVSKTTLNLAQPINRRKNDVKENKQKKFQSPEEKMMNAVKDVAETIGGDVKQTQSELLMKLLNTSEARETPNNLSDLMKGMKVDREQAVPHEQSKADQVRTLLKSKANTRMTPRRPEMVMEKIDLFGSEPLGIFTEMQSDATEGVENKIWNQLYKKDLKLAVTHPPNNYFQQMILWTDQGKVWKFPIDNEQGLEQEKKVYFTEHVFLEKHLEPWCPPSGPLRHFMELVCVGLSKNPYLTVQAKKEHIEWFKNYFEDKKQLLKDTGVIQDQKIDKQLNSGQKQIE